MSAMLVSIIIPCFNHGQYLRESVTSALNQTHPSIEVIVVDDGSTDTTPEVAKSFGDRIIYIRKLNAGLSAARNTGIERATGEYLLFLDADDYMDPEAVASHLTTARDHPDASLFASGWRHVDMSGRPMGEPMMPRVQGDALSSLLSGNIAPVMAMFIRRSILDTHNRFDETLKSHEDWDLWLRLVGQGCALCVTPKVLVNYRTVPGSMSGNIMRMYDTAQKVLGRARGLARRSPQCNESWIKGRDAFASKFWLEHFLPRYATAGSLAGRMRLAGQLAIRSVGDGWLRRRAVRWGFNTFTASIRRAMSRLPLIWRLVRSS